MGKLKGIKGKVEGVSKKKHGGKKKVVNKNSRVSEPQYPKDRSSNTSAISDDIVQSISFVKKESSINSPPDMNQAIVVKLSGFSLGMKGYIFGEKISNTSLVSLSESKSSSSLLDFMLKKDPSFYAWLRGRLIASGKSGISCKNCTISMLVDLYFKRSSEIEENLNNNLDVQAVQLAEDDHNYFQHSTPGSSSDLKPVLGMSSSEIFNQLNSDSFSLFELLLKQQEKSDLLKDIEEELRHYGIVISHSESTIEDPRKAAESPKKTPSATSGDDLRKLQHDLKKAQQELALLKAENSQLKDEGVRLRKVAMDDTVKSTPSHQAPTSTASVRAFPPVVYIVAAIILGLIIGKFIL